MTYRGPVRFAPHLGYLSPEQPLFLSSVGSTDPLAQIRFIADQGFAGIFDPWLISRPAMQIDRIIAAMREHGLESGGIAYASFQTMFSPLFAQVGRTASEELMQRFDSAIDLAGRVGARILAVVLQGTPELSRSEQLAAASEHLRRAGDRAASAGLTIGIEPMIALPDLMLGSTDEALEFLEATDHSAVRLIFDTGHVQAMDGDIHAAWNKSRAHVCVVQLADMPGRVQPGVGTLDLTRLLVEALTTDTVTHLVELEHGWAAASPAIEQAAIAELNAIANAVGAMTQGRDRHDAL
ncbi:Xylose isomerase domain-containing protein TIM barrel [Sphingobium chlorophenolicum L-1]|uniref:Xylose isomerase domain-containing protein TIM barrel n=1 Tax=Sphingobium chlorophenolicum L-1 TaxID=690566 RepID=F6F3D6_SPHCR|nr:sugar phosphate isomerase/epimerase family protein [Sphingobium chlorophenolicum]AEG50948.1 Xylose isomerase domain-containing protein TIM barrel [Sphingobium chlorophenolicum L-1]